MQFSINRIVLWPKKAGLTYREIPFEAGKINIITGSSRTGKSALIPIIDYCLCAQKCAIPVDVIRNACAWFGVLFDLQNEQLLLCRKEPGFNASSKEMLILRGRNVTIPEAIEPNTTSDEVKNLLNELFSISFLEIQYNIFTSKQRVIPWSQITQIGIRKGGRGTGGMLVITILGAPKWNPSRKSSGQTWYYLSNRPNVLILEKWRQAQAMIQTFYGPLDY